eukprot:gene310-6724_t
MLRTIFLILFFILCLKGKPIAYIVPHSHCDPGWIKTYEKYYNEDVRIILSNVMIQLKMDSKKRFIWSDISFWIPWWNEQTKDMKELVKGFIKTGQLEFVNGGYVTADEASTDYVNMIDQMTEGHHYLKETFNVKPTISWQIDPFGASKVFPILFQLMGYEYHIISRVDDRLKNKYDFIPNSGEYMKEKKFQFIWTPSESYTNISIFTHILDRHYSSPVKCIKKNETNIYDCTGFHFEEPENNPPITNENLYERSNLLVDIIKERASYFRTKHILIPFGNDFAFKDASIQFNNMDKLINEISNNDTYGINIQYSTLSEYFKAIRNDSNPSDFPVVSDTNFDFFPLTNCWADELNKYNSCIAYWTGYYSTYPNLKSLIRESSSILRTTELLFSTGLMNNVQLQLIEVIDWIDIFKTLDIFRKDLALVHHHDGITGTAKMNVRNDYEKRLKKGIKTSRLIMEQMISSFMGKTVRPEITMNFTAINDKSEFIPIIVYNSQSWAALDFVKIISETSKIELFDSRLQKINFNLIPRRDSKFDLFFIAESPAVGFDTYYSIRTNISTISKETNLKDKNEFYMENEFISLKFLKNNKIFELNSIYNKFMKKWINIKQELMEYTGLGSGAYIFMPKSDAVPIKINEKYIDIKYFDDDLVSEFQQRLNENVTQIFRIFKKTENTEVGIFFEFDIISNLDNDKELITRFTSKDIKSNNKFYTDSNGFEMIERIYQKKFNDSKRSNIISSNYYPHVSQSYIRDDSIQLTAFSKQAFGVSSLFNGSIEFMINRNTLKDDNRGVNERVKMTESSIAKFRILISSPSSSNSIRPKISQRFENPFTPFFFYGKYSQNGIKKEKLIPSFEKFYTTTFSTLSGDFPHNIHLLSMKAMKQESKYLSISGHAFKIIFRFQHLYEKMQDSTHSKIERIYIDKLFPDYVFSDSHLQSLTLNYDIYFPGRSIIELHPLDIWTYSSIVERKIFDDWWSWTSFVLGIAIAALFSLSIAFLGYLYLEYLKIHGQKSVVYNELELEKAENQF